MVPYKLTLKNFMSYKNATLDLEGVHLACLSGDNGAGKSAILDAMTWTLWGKARASDDELVSQGELEMQTDLEFKINEQFYRIVRTRNRRGAGQTIIYFHIRNPEAGWHNISGDSKIATQRRIIKELHMEYDTFINSAFLLQGRADEFMQKKPAERKELLADILGLNYYDELEAKAKDEAKIAELKRRNLDERLAEVNTQLDYKAVYEKQKKEAEVALEQSKIILTKNETELTSLLTHENALKDKEEQRQRILKQIKRDQEEVERLNERLKQLKIEIEKCNLVLSRGEQIEIGYRDFQNTEKLYDELSDKFHRYGQLVTRRQELENLIRKAEIKLEADIGANQKLLSEAAKQSQNLAGYEKEQANLQIQLTHTQTASENLENLKAQRQEAQTELKLADERVAQNTKELKKIKVRADDVPAVGEKCDRCGTVLDQAARDHTVEEYRNEYRDIQAASKELKIRQEMLKADLKKLEAEQTLLEEPVRRMAALQKQAGMLDANLANARQAQQKAKEYETKLAELNLRFEKKDFCQAERTELSAVNKEAKDLAFDREAYDRVRNRLSELRKFQNEKEALNTATQRIVSLKDDRERNEQDQLTAKNRAFENQADSKRLEAETTGLAALSAKRTEAQQRKNQATDDVKCYDRQVWEADSNLKKCQDLEEEKKQKTVEFEKSATQKSVYDELAVAFGKKGIQALIIDTVLPELEDEANRLLGRMSDGRMTIRFDTQRDTKKGTAVETLELRISDENGVRSYELFSGGEAFRVNFAIRIALSKLLARRSGAALQTLVIDEGFGTQDGSGRERLIEAIHSIENEFKRILVVTHIQELKDVFPVRIDIVKTNAGSQISIT